MINASLIISPIIPISLLIPLILVSLVYCFYLLLRQTKGCYLRIFTIIILIIALLDPAIQDEKRQSQKSYVAIVVDRSDSQKIAQRLTQTDAALDLLKKRLAAFPNIEPKIIDYSTTDNGASGTRLFEIGRAHV